MKTYRTSALACLFGVLTATAAYADDCSGRDHTAGTVLGAAGGAAIGGAATRDAGGAIAGALVGGLAGNAISRAQDCDRGSYGRGRYQGQGYGNGYGNGTPVVSYYGEGYQTAPDEEDYWGVESYVDFSADYRHIYESIQRAQERGTLKPYEARRFSQRLQRIRFRADADQRRGRFDPQATEEQLRELREDMRSARRENRDEQNGGYNRR
jgi:hypothetical protein